MAHFAGRREIGVKFPMRAASVDPKSTQLTPLTIANYSHLRALRGAAQRRRRLGAAHAPAARVVQDREQHQLRRGRRGHAHDDAQRGVQER